MEAICGSDSAVSNSQDPDADRLSNSALASSLLAGLKQHFERLRVQIQQDLRTELQELRQDMSKAQLDVTNSAYQAHRSKSVRKNAWADSPRSPHTNKSGNEVTLTALAGVPRPGNDVSILSLQDDLPTPRASEIVLCPSPRASEMVLRSWGRAGSTEEWEPPGHPPTLSRASVAHTEVTPAEPRVLLSSSNYSSASRPLPSMRSVIEAEGDNHTPSIQEASNEIDRAVEKVMTHNLVDLRRPRTLGLHRDCLQRLADRIPIFHPRGKCNKVWSPAIYIAVLFVVMFAPFEVAFYWWDPPLYYKIVSTFLDVVFLLDMALHFNTAYYHNGKLVTERREIAMHYIRSYFVLDCIANFPFDWFLGGTSQSRKFTKLGKLPKVLRFFRLLAVFKEHVEYIGVTAALGLVFLLGHYATCLWTASLAGGCEDNNSCPDVAETYLQTFRISLSGYLSSETFSRHFVLARESSNAKLAVASLRDVGEPLKAHEDILAILVNLFGLLVIAFTFGNVASAFRLRSELSQQRKKLLDRRMEELSLIHTPRHVSKKVVAFYRYMWADGSAHLTDPRNGVLRDPALSLWQRREIAYHAYGPALQSVPIFADIPERFLKCLCQKVEVNHYAPGDYVVIFGEVGRELYIITEGKARPMTQYGQWLGHASFEAGQIFGEISFLNPDARRAASVVCLQFTRALVVTLQAFKDLNLCDTLDSMRRDALQYGVTAPPGCTSQALKSHDLDA